MIKKIINNLKYIKLKDLLGFFILIIALPFSYFFRLKNKILHREIWLICESKDTARDNGYHFFKYVRENYPKDFCYYAINKKSDDYKKIEKYGNIIQFASFKHWVYYLSAKYNISTQKAGNPCAPIFYVLQVYGILKNKRIFLQHGITKDDNSYIYYKNAKFRLFICGAKKEYEYILSKFGYPDKFVKYTGFARFDNLHNLSINRKQILVMPTWRNWLGRDLNFFSHYDNFYETEYYKKWNSLINNSSLIEILNENDIVLYFYPHVHMQKYLKYFKSKSNNVKIVDNSLIDIQDLLKDSALLITDYSSVFMDFAYMRKPLIYYQFDQDEFRKRHLKKGYFSYESDGFGEVIKDECVLIKKIHHYIKNDFENETIYNNKMKDFFELYDDNNCKRIYEAIKDISKEIK